jgi:tetratricopeptide (TPR) repeat protein
MLEKSKLEHPVLIALLLALVVVAVHLPVVRFDFTNYDDNEYVTRNPQVLKGLTWEGARWAFTHGHSANWHPVTWLSHMLDCQLYGLKSGGHHLTNLLLHAANTALVFLVLRCLTGAVWRSACVAALFGLHPLHVESVAWVAERKDVLSAFFGLLCLWAYGYYVENSEGRNPKSEGNPKADLRRDGGQSTMAAPNSDLRAPIFYLLSLTFFALGLMSKPMLVTWPCLLLVLDFWPLRRFHPPAGELADAASSGVRVAWRLLVEKLPFFALSASSCAVTFLVQRAWGGLVPLEHVPVGPRLLNVPVSYCRYLAKLVWPTDLAVMYPYVRGWPAVAVVGSVLVLAGATVLVLWQWRRRPYLLAGWAWFLGTLVPVIGLVQVGSQSMADRYTYLPSIGFFLLAVWGAAEVIGASPARRLIGGIAAAAILSACAFLTRSQAVCWQNTETLFQHALKVTSGNVVAHNSLGFYYASRKQPQEAERAFRAALVIQTNSAYSWQGLAMALIDQQKHMEAIAACQAALVAEPSMAAAQSTMGLALMKLGRTNEAVACYSEALRLQPKQAEAHYNLANALASQGQIEAARQHYEASLRSDPGSADAHNNLAYMFLREDKREWAESEFKSALVLQPDLWPAHYGLATVLVRQGKIPEAIQHYCETLVARPEFVEVLIRLAWILAVNPDPQVRDGSQAVELAERACRLTQSRQPGTLRTLAVAYAEAGRFADAIRAAQEAQRLAEGAGQTEFARGTQQLLELFQAGQPYREAMPAKSP